MTVAAEALIEAVSLEADATTQKRLTASLDSLKSSFDDNLNRVAQKMQSSSENFDSKINTLTQHAVNMRSDIGALRSDIGALTKLLEDEWKQKTLERALVLADLNSFTYYEGINTKTSTELVKKVIGWFMLDQGFNLPKTPWLDKAFVDKFALQIKALIKREPRLVKKTDGSYAIFYE